MIYPWVVWWNMWAAMWMPSNTESYKPGDVLDYHDYAQARRAWGKKCG